MAKKPIMRDVSRLSGLSVYTVSRVLNNAGGVSEESRRRVLDAANELGYVLNRTARELRKNTRSTVAVMTASTSNYYYIDLMNGIQRTLREGGRTAVVADIAVEGEYSAEVEDSTVQDLIQSRIAGVISTLTLAEHNMKLLENWDVPVVFVDSKPSSDDRPVASVTTDNVAASMAVGAHLAEHGYDDWLFLVYPARWSTRIDRERGIRQAADLHGAKIEVVESGNDASSAYRTLDAYLESTGRLPRAVIAGNNPMVHGTLSVLHDRGVEIPRDVAVVAYDEFAWAPLLNPPLTVLNEDSETIGRLAARTLARIIDEQARADDDGTSVAPLYRPEDRQEVPAELVIRRSCGC